MILAVSAASLLAAVIEAVLLIPRLHRTGITGTDVSEPHRRVRTVSCPDCGGVE